MVELFDGVSWNVVSGTYQLFDPARGEGYMLALALSLQTFVVGKDRVDIVIELGCVLFANLANLFYDRIFHNPQPPINCSGLQRVGIWKVALIVAVVAAVRSVYSSP